MATVSDSDSVLLTAIMTPLKNLTLYASNNIKKESTVKCLPYELGISLSTGGIAHNISAGKVY